MYLFPFPQISSTGVEGAEQGAGVAGWMVSVLATGDAHGWLHGAALGSEVQVERGLHCRVGVCHLKSIPLGLQHHPASDRRVI